MEWTKEEIATLAGLPHFKSVIVMVWNEYCDKGDGNATEHVYRMTEFDDIYRTLKPSEIVNMIDSNFDLTDEFFKEDETGVNGVASSNFITDLIDIQELADYLNNKTVELVLAHNGKVTVL